MKVEKTSPLAPISFPTLPPVRGVQTAVARLGLYKYERNELIVALVDEGSSVGGAFTRSSTRSCDVEWCAANVAAGGSARALVAHAGNSNAFTGAAGEAKNAATVAAVQALLGCAPNHVMLAATGVIGAPVPADTVARHLPAVWPTLAQPHWETLARTIMTTDTFPKGAGASVEIDGVPVHLAGIAKGSGMIAPNMATMLVFMFTDAALSPAVVQALVSRHVDATFNSITVDSDTSTSDTVLLYATGASGAPLIDDANDSRLAAFDAALRATMLDLAHQVVRDGEGASKFIQIEVQGAVSEASARTIAMAIANSPLVKTAICGEDANWGRVIMAVGKSGEPVSREKLSVRFGGIWTARDGGAVAYDEAPINKHMAGQNIDILVDVGMGDGSATVWTCDLTKEYVAINGDYRS
jgi:glutamate N-acetyltransferase/amino-acid N-acetyltransferase